MNTNYDYRMHTDAFINGKMSAYYTILDKIESENASLEDIVEYIKSNEQYKKWCGS